MNGNNALRADTDSARRNTINPLLILLGPDSERATGPVLARAAAA